jgi:hypothetical protein
MGESAQLSFTSKFVGQKFADLEKIHPNRQTFARNFLGQNLTARIRPFRTSFAKKKITV